MISPLIYYIILVLGVTVCWLWALWGVNLWIGTP